MDGVTVMSMISIHAPREGSDGRLVAGGIAAEISIHAPREWSDGQVPAGKPDDANFYPRSPRGERQSCLVLLLF